jgi:hypothetical protein
MRLSLHKNFSIVPCINDMEYLPQHSSVIEWKTYHKNYGQILCHLYIYKNYILEKSELLKVVQQILEKTEGFKKTIEKVAFSCYCINEGRLSLELKNINIPTHQLLEYLKKGKNEE